MSALCGPPGCYRRLGPRIPHDHGRQPGGHRQRQDGTLVGRRAILVWYHRELLGRRIPCRVSTGAYCLSLSCPLLTSRQMGIAVVLTPVLYVLIWLRIRGNIHVGDRWYPTFTIRHREHAPRASSMANQVLWHPLVYSALMAPLFVVRVGLLLNVRVPWQALDATIVVFLLSGKPLPVRFPKYITTTCCTGLANVILYTSTRRFFILPHIMRHARNRSVEHQKQVVSSTQPLPQYQREALESQSVINSTTPTLVSLGHTHHTFLHSPSISAPSSLPSIAVDLTSPRQAPKPPSKSNLRASHSLGGSIPARPAGIAPALLVERRLTMQILIPPFSWKNADSPSPSTPQTSYA